MLLNILTLTACKTQTEPKLTTIKIENIELTVPTEYTPLSKTEVDPLISGKFAAYDFTDPKIENFPVLYNISLSSRELTKQANTKCSLKKENPEWPCSFAPTIKEYDEQKQALINNEDYNDLKLQNLNSRNYLVYNKKCDGDSCLMRTYITYIDNTRIETVIEIWGDISTESEKADSVMSKISIN